MASSVNTFSKIVERVFMLLLIIVLMTGALPAIAQTPNSGTATVLVVDLSGSMNDLDGSGQVKLEGAKAAASEIITAIGQENSLGKVIHQAGLISFANRAVVISELATDTTTLLQAVQGMVADGGTNIGDGLLRGLDILDGTPAGTDKVIILLSDGVPTEGIEQVQEFLDGPVARARGQGTCIYAVGLGTGGEMNAELLRSIAEGSGCGQYFLADEVFQLRSIYMRLRHETTGENVKTWEGTIQQGEEKSLGVYSVPPDQESMDVSLVWPGSKVQFKLSDPTGTLVDPTRSDIQYFPGQASERLIIRDPLPGEWQLRIVGVEVPKGITAFSAAASTRLKVVINTATPLPTDTPTATPVPTVTAIPTPPPEEEEMPKTGGLWLLVLAGLVVAGTAGVVALARRRRSEGQTWLELSTGDTTPHRVDVRKMPFNIGRSADNDLVLNDSSISRRHAVIRRTAQGFEIEDLGSTSGTFVNGRRVVRSALVDNDLITMAGMTLRFHC